MSEEELQDYLDAIDNIDRRRMAENRELQEPCRDDDGYVVPGCSYTLPAPAAD